MRKDTILPSLGDEHGCDTEYRAAGVIPRSEAAEAPASDLQDVYWHRGSKVPHGTYSRYTNGHCRCDLCRAANTWACFLRRNGRGPGRRPWTHGTTGGYQAGCRCKDCAKAKRASRALTKERRAKREATAPLSETAA